MFKLFTTFFLITLAGFVWSDFDFDELEQLEKLEQQELLHEANKAANDWDFSKAEDFIDQAEQKSYDPDSVKTSRNILKEQKFAKAEKERKELEAKEAAERKRKEEEEQKRLARERSQSQGSSGGSSSGSYVDYVMVTVSPNGYNDSIKNLNISGCGSVSVISRGTEPVVSINKGYNGCLGGRYNISFYYDGGAFIGRGDKASCSGSFYVSGQKRNVYINVTSSCSMIKNEF